MVSMRQLARLAGVSPGLVSRVLNHDPTLAVAPATRQRIQDLAAQYHYVPGKRGPGKKWINSLCVITAVAEKDEVYDDYFKVIMTGITIAARENGLNVKTIYRLPEGPAMPDIEKYAGIVMIGSITPAAIASIAARNAHVVLIDNQVVTAGYPAVGVDLAAMARDALMVFTTRNVAPIGFIGNTVRGMTLAGKLDMEVAGGRLAEYRRFCQQTHQPDYSVLGAWDPAFGYRATRQLLTAHPEIQALLIASDPLALGALRAVADLNLRIPAELEVLSFDDLDYAQYLIPRLSTAKLPTQELGRRAVQLLYQQLTTAQVIPEQITLRGELRMRETTKKA